MPAFGRNKQFKRAVEGPAVLLFSPVQRDLGYAAVFACTCTNRVKREECHPERSFRIRCARILGATNNSSAQSKDLRVSVPQALPPSFGKLTRCAYPPIMRERWYYVYIVASRTHALYIGVTGRIEQRISEHKNKAFQGFTADYNCNRLVYYERYDNPGQAIAREKQLKGWSRPKKLALIQKMNSTWIDLSEEWGRPIPLFAESHRQKA
ncbi:MAG: GIY-YIG nuclease family protein [Acidobacteriaceae bacterium]